MSDTMAELPKASKYLIAQLARNPQLQSGEIIAARARALQLADKPVTSRGGDGRHQPVDRRQTLARQLETLREECFNAPAPLLTVQLASLKLDDYPDLRRLADRLLTLVAVREKLPELTQHKDFDGDFWSVFREVLTGKPSEVAVTRERILASFRKSAIRKRGRRMIGLLETEAPELYRLERDWLESLKRPRQGNNLAFIPQRETKQNGAPTSYSWTTAIVVVVALTLIKLGTSFVRDREKPDPPSFDIPNFQRLEPLRAPEPIVPDYTKGIRTQPGTGNLRHIPMPTPPEPAFQRAETIREQQRSHLRHSAPPDFVPPSNRP